jgi:hypothetical protein
MVWDIIQALTGLNRGRKITKIPRSQNRPEYRSSDSKNKHVFHRMMDGWIACNAPTESSVKMLTEQTSAEYLIAELGSRSGKATVENRYQCSHG